MIFFSIILTVGILTTYTDLKSKKIYNQHLFTGAILGVLSIAYVGLFEQENINFHILNGIVAFIIGFLIHRLAFWKGGDAKLFALYSFLMPPSAYNHFPLSNIINLFANSFIVGMVILLPIFIKDVVVNHNTILTDLCSLSSRRSIFEASVTVVIFSWVLFPVYYLGSITNPAIIMTISFLLFNWGYGDKKADANYRIMEHIKKKSFPLLFYFTFGLLTRLILSPKSLSLPSLARSILTITLSAIASFCIHATFKHFKDYNERVPFAPLLFIGCLLNYTPFLQWMTHLTHR